MAAHRHDAFEREGWLFLAVGLVLAPLVFGWLIVNLVHQQDSRINRVLCEQAERMLGFLADRQEATLLDYAIWDELYENAVVAPDARWFGRNVGFEMDTSVGRTAILVLDAEGSPVFEPDAEEDGGRIVAADLTGDFRTALDTVLAPNGTDHLVGFMPYRDTLALVGIARIRTQTGAATEALPPRLLVFAEIFDAEAQARLQDVMTWQDLVLVPGDSPEGHFPIRGIDDSIVGHAAWAPPDLAMQTLRGQAPFFGLGLLLLGGATMGLFNRLRRRSRRLLLAEAAANRLAHTDALTGLPNRRALTDALCRRLKAGASIHVLAVDFDGFKEINDRLGHRHGDALLIEMAGRMGRALPAGALLARIGGDEFAILLEAEPAEAWELAQDLVLLVAAPFEMLAQTVAISAGVGIAASAPGVGFDELMRRADVAMHEAKRRRPGMTMRYDDRFDEQQRLETALDAEMRAGLDRGEFWVAYQPIFAEGHDEPVAVEALARWNHPVRGPVSPGVFIPVAERSRLILELGDFVLRTACGRLAEQEGDLALSVNLSPVQLLDTCIVERIAAILAETGFPADRLELEVTEGYLVEQEERAVILLERLRKLGVRLSLDDFGVGYASVGYLRRFPLDKVKIDRSFVAPIGTDPQAGRVVSGVVSLVRAFEMSITAEGVETEAQAAYLRSIGCDRLQGFLLGRPSADLPPRRNRDSASG